MRLTVRGAEIEVDRSGLGPTLIWGHGLSSSRDREDIAPLVRWPQISADVVRYDARGHGASETTPDVDSYSWAALALDQLELADQLQIDTYVSGGASMGCGTALHCAVTAPDRIRALILAIPPTGWETRALQAGEWGKTAAAIDAKGVEFIIDAQAAIPPPAPFSSDPEWYERRAASLRAWDPARLAQVFRGAVTANLPERALISSIQIPTLILAWEGDATHPTSTANELHELIDGSELHVATSEHDLASWTDRVSRFMANL